ncbi:hypothetical protein BCR34DRAFT_581909 [Clohesyomyces aquaticus]|uniref:Uncharacterized protein n=1 Tax=Clohesyomyces aquaticus TaxID=1231657 RepID=A0A1Y2AAX8_9PLEO|nr:hypothetical protein BCR34DRAFT_581909 [Clohesyomyces aquaticus]
MEIIPHKRRPEAGDEDDDFPCKRYKATIPPPDAKRSIANFPDELLLNILSSVSEDKPALKTYNSLYRVSKSFNRVTPEFLWREAQLQWKTDNIPFITSLTERPDLATMVKKINSSPQGPGERPPLMRARRDIDIRAVVRGLENLQYPEADRWAHHFPKKSIPGYSRPEFELGVLLCHTPNLESLFGAFHGDVNKFDGDWFRPEELRYWGREEEIADGECIDADGRRFLSVEYAGLRDSSRFSSSTFLCACTTSAPMSTLHC